MFSVLLVLLGQTSAPGPIQVDDLAKRSTVLRTLNPTLADDDYSDLEPFLKAVGNRRIVMLGEQTHVDGSTFDLRTRLVKALHKRLGFDLVVFEMDMSAAQRLDDELSGELPLRSVLADSAFRTVIRHEYELFRYVRETLKSPHPMHVAGHDITYYLSPPLISDLQRELGGSNPGFANHVAWLELRDLLFKRTSFAAFQKRPITDEEILRVHSQVAWIEKELPAATNVPPTSRQAFYRQVLSRLPDGFENLVESLRGKGTLQVPLRDRVMGEILLWMATRWRPNSKIVVLSASLHQMRSGTSSAPTHLQSFVTMGEWVRRRLDRQTYSTTFEVLDGKVGPFRQFKDGKDMGLVYFDVDPADPASLAVAFGKLPGDLRFLDYRSLPARHWLRSRTVQRGLGYENYDAAWPDIADGVFFIRTMKPSDQAIGRMPDVPGGSRSP